MLVFPVLGEQPGGDGQRAGEFAASAGDALFVLGVRIGVQEHDCDRLGSLERLDEAVTYRSSSASTILPSGPILTLYADAVLSVKQQSRWPTSAYGCGRSCRPISTTSSNPAFVISFARSWKRGRHSGRSVRERGASSRLVERSLDPFQHGFGWVDGVRGP